MSVDNMFQQRADDRLIDSVVFFLGGLVVLFPWHFAVLASLDLHYRFRSYLALPHVSTACAWLSHVSKERMKKMQNCNRNCSFCPDSTVFHRWTEATWAQVDLGTWGCTPTALQERLVLLTVGCWEKTTSTITLHRGSVSNKTPHTYVQWTYLVIGSGF